MTFWNGSEWVADPATRPSTPSRRLGPRRRLPFLTIVIGLLLIASGPRLGRLVGIVRHRPRRERSERDRHRRSACPGELVVIDGRGFKAHQVYQVHWDSVARAIRLVWPNSQGQLPRSPADPRRGRRRHPRRHLLAGRSSERRPRRRGHGRDVRPHPTAVRRPRERPRREQQRQRRDPADDRVTIGVTEHHPDRGRRDVEPEQAGDGPGGIRHDERIRHGYDARADVHAHDPRPAGQRPHAGHAYHFRVKSKDSAGNLVASSDSTFRPSTRRATRPIRRRPRTRRRRPIRRRPRIRPRRPSDRDARSDRDPRTGHHRDLRRRVQLRHQGQPPGRLDRPGQARPPVRGQHDLGAHERPLPAARRPDLLRWHRRDDPDHRAPGRWQRRAVIDRPVHGHLCPRATPRAPGRPTTPCRSGRRPRSAGAPATTSSSRTSTQTRSTNYFSVNELFVYGSTLTPRQPAFADATTRSCTPTPSSWSVQGRYTADMDLTYANGAHDGMAYIANIVELYGTISGSASVREHFTVSGGNRTVTKAYVRVRRTSGSSPLTIRLETGSGIAHRGGDRRRRAPSRRAPPAATTAGPCGCR